VREEYYSNSKDYINRWIISYADLVTLLLALFLVMFIANKSQTNDIPKVTKVDNSAIEKTLKEEFKENEIDLLKDDRGYILRLPEKILFETAKADLSEESCKLLDKITDILSKIDNPVIIEGHTDSVPISSAKFASNRELSVIGAAKVVDYFIATGKINPKRLTAAGYGEYVPVAENTSNSGRTKNRRVDIIILEKNIGE